MSKASLARLVIERKASSKSFNTLRKLSIKDLEALLVVQRLEVATTPVIVETPVYIPTDAEIMQAAAPVPMAISADDVPVATRCNSYAGLVVLALIPLYYALNFILG